MENVIITLWNRNKIILKSFWIGILTLLLLIPTLFIQNLVEERQQRQQEAVTEVSSRWAGVQTVTGPVIGIPYMAAAEGGSSSGPVKHWAYFLPASLDMSAHIVPEKRYRGIYQVIVYTTELQVHGTYDSLHLAELNIPAGQWLWNEAAVFFDLGDLQGLKEQVRLHLGPALSSAVTGTADLDLIPGKFSTDQFKSALSAPLPGWLSQATEGPLTFSATVRFKGTGNLSFIPTGRETKVEAFSSWPDPSFTGANLPDLRTVKDSGFIADWRVLALNRSFPQQWKAD